MATVATLQTDGHSWEQHFAAFEIEHEDEWMAQCTESNGAAGPGPGGDGTEAAAAAAAVML